MSIDSSGATHQKSPKKIAIVGGGPRGQWAVEELIAGYDSASMPPLMITVFDKGGLRAYETDQPRYWRLNALPTVLRTHTMGEFSDWAGSESEYFPRALAGEFLQLSWDRLEIPSGIELTRLSENIADAEELLNSFDEVLVVSGHDSSWAGELPGALKVYPAGGLDAVTPGSSVSIRGLSLTFIDALLELTLGRGGSFEDEKYIPSGNEPSAIQPFSRSGRFMDVKPELEFAPDTIEMLRIQVPKIEAAANSEDLIEALAEGAMLLAPEISREAFVDVLEGRDSTGDPVEDLRISLEVATGKRELTAPAAIAAALRDLYPAIIKRVSYSDAFTDFNARTRRLERVAFGYPAVNAQNLLSAIECGLVKTDTTSQKEADFLVDAVLPPVPNQPIRTLKNGFLEEDGNMAFAGRMTEGWIYGNDTLCRDWHETIPLWAETVLSRIAS